MQIYSGTKAKRQNHPISYFYQNIYLLWIYLLGILEAVSQVFPTPMFPRGWKLKKGLMKPLLIF